MSGLGSVCAPPALAGWWDAAATSEEVGLDALEHTETLPLDVTLLVVAHVRAAPGGIVLSGTADGRALATLQVRRGTLAADRADDTPGGTLCQVHLVALERDGRLVLEALRLTRPGDGFTPEENGRLRRADAFLAAENPGAAAQQLEALLARRPFATTDRVGLLLRVARAFIEDRAPKRARSAFLEVLSLAPDDAAAKAGIARLDERPPTPTAVSGRTGAVPPLPPPSLPVPELPPGAKPSPRVAAPSKDPAKPPEKPARDPEDEPIPAPAPPPLSDPR